MRRRIYLMRHGDVAYFDAEGRPFPPDQVPLTAQGQAQALAAGEVFASARLDRVITSGMPRAVETAELVLSRVAHRPPIETWPELREIKGGRLGDIPDAELETEFLAAFDGRLAPETTRFLRGETIGELLDRVLPALERLLADASWDTVLLVLHGGVNRAILSHALLGGRAFLGNLAQSPGCINALDVGSDWILRAVNFCPTDAAHQSGRLTTMEELLQQYLAYRKGMG